MSTKKLTIEPTEADFEASIRGAIELAFPWVPPGEIQHQTKFSVRVGRKTVEVKSRADEARADIILYSNSRPVAVLELKRHGHSLTRDDEEQGLCYAKLLNPPAPLTVVSNGSETRILDTFSGQEWKPTTPDESTLDNLFKNAGRVAAAQITDSVAALLGGDSNAWVPAIEAVTREQLDDLAGDLADASFPFARSFCFSRQATAVCRYHLDKGEKLVVLSGPP
ncbi:hypothetical protein DBR45_21840, partial [Pseudomonas sp. HMWF031]